MCRSAESLLDDRLEPVPNEPKQAMTNLFRLLVEKHKVCGKVADQRRKN